MASIRRTLSPAHHDRLYLNGGGSFSASSPSHKFLPTPGCTSSGGTVARFMYSFPFMVMGSVYRAFLIGICPKKYSRLFEKSKRGQVWKKSLLQFFLCFMLGLLSGFTPFSLVDLSANLSSKRQDFSFELKSPMVNSRQDFSRVVKRGRAIETVKSDGIVAVELEAKRDVESKVLAVPKFDFVPRKLLIIVTPTFNRALQAYHLNRLAQTLRLVPPPLLWIVVEMPSASMETAEILMRAGVMHRHLVCKKNLTSIKDRGVHQRNEALEHIRHHNIDGIVYFADDDNVYSLKLFKQMRDIRRFGTCPVAMLAQSKNKVILEGPVCNASKVIGWHTNEKSKRLRRFHVDMSGFAFNSTILWDPKRWHRPTSDPIKQLDTVKEGFQETTFIEQIVEDEGQMEGLPHGCSQIMAWHLHLEAPDLVYPKGWFLQKNLDCIIPLKHVGTA